MAGNQAIWGAPMNVSDMPDGVHAMLRTGRISPTNMPWPDNDPRRLMVAGADSGEFAMARGEEMPFAANQGTSADPVAPGSEQPGGEQPGQENGFWQSGWGQGAGI